MIADQMLIKGIRKFLNGSIDDGTTFWTASVVDEHMNDAPLSDKIINVIYGGQYNEAGSVLMIHIWTGVFVFLGVAFSGYLSIENQTKKAFYRTLLGAIFNIILNFL